MTIFHAVGSAAQASVSAPGGIARFVGHGKVFWRLLSRGAVLLMFTLGIYRFWLTTDIRRYLWSNTEVADESFEYTGTARELLLGFLIAIAVLVPLYAAFFLLTLTLGERRDMELARPPYPDFSRSVCCLSRASLPPQSHRLSRHSLPSDRVGFPLFRLCRAVVDADPHEFRPCLSICPISARAFQDAPHLFRQPARPL